MSSAPVVPYGAPAAPGAAPSVTPPQGSFTQGDQATVQPGAQDQDQIKKILQMVMAQQQKPQLAQPVPAPISEPKQPQDTRSNLTNFANHFGNTIQTAIANKKKSDLAKAESDWNQLTSIMQSDPQKAQLWLAQNDKAAKNMAKALNQDWLNPEKTTVYKQALDNVMKTQAAKSKAATGLKDMMKKLIGKATQPQLTDQQKQQSAQERLSNAPMTTTPTDPLKTMQGETDVMKAYADVTRATTEARDKYTVTATADGKMLAYDKADPKNHFYLTDEDGSKISGAVKGTSGTGKVAMIGQVPFGITGIRDGKPVVKTPGDPDWTGDDAKTFAAAKAASAQVQSNADHRNQVAAQARAQAYASTREYGVIDSQTGGLAMISPDVINKNPGRYAPASQAIQVKNRSSLFDEIDYTSKQVNQAINDLPDTGFDAKSRAQISAVLRDNDPRSALSTFLSSEAAGTLSDAQVNYLTGLVSLDESAMSLRSLGGMGQGSDSVRNAIVRMLPGTGTPSKKYAQRQMQLFQGEVDQLRKSVPKLGGNANANQPQPPGPARPGMKWQQNTRTGEYRQVPAQ